MIFTYTELFDCQHNHYLKNISIFRNIYKYTDFLSLIYSNTIKGFLILKGLSIRKSSRSPYQGM